MNLTPRGTAILAGGLASLAVGALAGSTAASVTGLAAILSLAFAANRVRVPEIDVRRRLEAPVGREGVPVKVELAMPEDATSRVTVTDELPPGLEATSGEPRLEGDETSVVYEVTARLPRHLDLGPALAQARDPLGLIQHEEEVGEVTQLTALPRTTESDEVTTASMARMLSGDHQTGQRGIGSDFYALREYQDGDSIRQVNWKASARTGDDELIVNQRERESQARVTILFDARRAARVGTVGTNAWVMGTRAAASIAEAAAQLRDDPRLVLYGRQAPETHTPNSGQPLEQGLLEPLLAGRPKGDAPLTNGVEELRTDLEDGEPVALVTHALGDETIPDAALTLGATGANLLVVSPDGGDLIERAGADEDTVLEARRTRRKRLDRLRALGATVVDWNPEEPLHQAVDRAMEVAT